MRVKLKELIEIVRLLNKLIAEVITLAGTVTLLILAIKSIIELT